MQKQKILLNGKKLVWESDPYVPHSKLPKFVGREKEMELIMASWITESNATPLNPLLEGPPGVGKNRIIYELARYTNRDLYIFQGNEDITAEDLACSIRFSDDTANLMEYVISPLITAMIKGSIFFIDEIGKIRPRALALLASVLDERRYIDSSLLGDRVYAHPGFRFIAATNTGEVGLLPEFIRSRIRPVIKISFPSRLEIEEIIRKHFKIRIKNLTALLEKFWYTLDEKGSDLNPPTPRDALAVFSMASSLGHFETNNCIKKTINKNNMDVFAYNSRDHGSIVTFTHLERAIKEIYG